MRGYTRPESGNLCIRIFGGQPAHAPRDFDRPAQQRLRDFALWGSIDLFGILTFAYAAAAALVAGIGLAATSSIAVLMLTIFAAGFFVIGSQYCMNALAANYYPTALRSTGVGWALGIGRIGSIIGPVVGGAMMALGWQTGQLFLATAMPAVLAAIAVVSIGVCAGTQRAATR